ncbi:MAG TPA: cation-efflux pump [Clostridiales bacterium]|nr:cation-efflux pump [Clostridiales bacterium]
MCGVLGIFLNVLLFCIKYFAGILSGSIAITADAFNNLSDAGSSIVTAVGFKVSAQKPDIAHPFGHGRLEYISGLIVSLIILLVGIELLKSSISKIITPTEIDLSSTAFVVLIISIAVKSYMAFYNSRIGRKLGSSAMRAAAKDSISDCLATGAVLISMLITYYTGLNTDGYFGLLVALFVLFTGYTSVRDTMSPLLGQPPDSEFVRGIKETVLAHPEVVGIHDLIVHDYGPGRQMISLHAEVPAEADILAVHDVIDNIEKEIHNKFGCTAVIHMDPILTSDPKTLETKELVTALIADIDSRITIHDFRIVTGPTHTNVIFDIVVPYDIKKPEAAIKEEISEKVRKADATLFTVIEIDRENA